MPAIIEFPTLVQAAVPEFGEVFAHKPERRHFAEYLTGLLVAERKTVSGSNREFAVTTDHSCLTRCSLSVAASQSTSVIQRVAWLQRAPTTRYAAHGVSALDNTRVSHEGDLMEEVGWFWDHADQRPLITRDSLSAHSVCASGKHSALDCRRFRTQEACAPVGQEAPAPSRGGRAEGGPPPFTSPTDLFKLERAITLDPHYATAYAMLADTLNWTGRPKEAIGLMKKAMRLNPHYQQYQDWYLAFLDHAYRLAGQAEDAVVTLKRSLIHTSCFDRHTEYRQEAYCSISGRRGRPRP